MRSTWVGRTDDGGDRATQVSLLQYSGAIQARRMTAGKDLPFASVAQPGELTAFGRVMRVRALPEASTYPPSGSRRQISTAAQHGVDHRKVTCTGVWPSRSRYGRAWAWCRRRTANGLDFAP